MCTHTHVCVSVCVCTPQSFAVHPETNNVQIMLQKQWFPEAQTHHGSAVCQVTGKRGTRPPVLMEPTESKESHKTKK